MNTFRPFTADSLPPEDTVILVRYKRSRLLGRETTATAGERNLVFPAVVVYRRAPYSRTERVFAGVTLLAPSGRHTENLIYRDEDVESLLDSWMPCPE